MSRPSDPHADIDALCDALAVALLLLNQHEIVDLSETSAETANKRLNGLQGSDQNEIIAAGLTIMARSRAVH